MDIINEYHKPFYAERIGWTPPSCPAEYANVKDCGDAPDRVTYDPPNVRHVLALTDNRPRLHAKSLPALGDAETPVAPIDIPVVQVPASDVPAVEILMPAGDGGVSLVPASTPA